MTEQAGLQAGLFLLLPHFPLFFLSKTPHFLGFTDFNKTCMMEITKEKSSGKGLGFNNLPTLSLNYSGFSTPFVKVI
jgi:hypothetical protein